MIIVETERLILRHFHAFDGEDMDRVFGDAEVMRFGPGVQTRQWVRDWLRGCLEDYYQKLGFGPWAVVEKNSRAVIGYCGLFYFPAVGGRPEIEIGYRLARAFWGQGYATEAVSAVRDYGFGVLCLPRLIALIDPQNVASLRVAEKAGMRYEREAMLEGYDHPDHVYSVVNPARVTNG
jgi:ribosomal-protein-alanine N-acetyltransferase